MKIIRFDSIGGASGDMILGALLDLGADLDALKALLSSLPIDPFDILAENFASDGLHGTKVRVKVEESPHVHRHLKDIIGILEGGELSASVREKSAVVFRKLAQAEACVHDSSPEKVHFHEVGAMDSIVDIIGSCIALDQLDVDGVVTGPLPMGQGSITCAHGIYPNPPPATMELLRGMSVVSTDEPHELVTPTGAALLSSWVTSSPPSRECIVEKIGYGFGHRKLDGRPNVLRASLLRVADVRSQDSCTVLECNLDDMTPELIGSLVDRIQEAGALDVYTTAVQMKKQRPGVLITVLTKPEIKEQLLDLIFLESTTFGIREYESKRSVLKRESLRVETEYGLVKVKVGEWKGEAITFSPEMDDCILLAKQLGVPVRQVYDAACAVARKSPSLV